MHKADKLTILLKAKEIAVNEAARYFSEVTEVVEGRRERYEALRSEKLSSEAKLTSSRGVMRARAIREGDAQALSSLTRYGNRLVKEIARLEVSLSRSMEELSLARQRANIAHEELVEARVEQKKIETLIGRRRQSEYISQAAEDDAMLDEMSALKVSSKAK